MRTIYILAVLISWAMASPASASYSTPVMDYSEIVTESDNEQDTASE